MLQAVFPDMGFTYTTAPMDAVQITMDALHKGFNTIIACGGDGTNNEVLNGFMNPEGAPRMPYASLGFFPSGTGGDFGKTIRLPHTPGELVRYIRAGIRRPMDIGHMEYISTRGEHAKRFFLNIMSFGIGGLVDHYVNKAPKVLGGKVSFFIGTLRAMLHYRNLPVRLVLDNEPVYDGPVRLVAVANGRYFGGGMMVAPDAEVDDGLLDVIVFKAMSTWDFMRLSGTIYSGNHIGHPLIDVYRAHTISASGHHGLLIDMDGEEAGSTPVTVRCIRHAVNIIRMPEGESE